ncbi:MAG: alanine racemase [Mailhella sp.]|nr:alanine racemase [Mailhella sp.]
MARLAVRLDALRHNAALVAQACTRAGAACLPVMKSAVLHPEIAQSIAEGAKVQSFGTVAWPEHENHCLRGLELQHIYAPSVQLVGKLEEFSTVFVSSQYELRLLHGHCRKKHPALRLSLECGDGRDGFLPEEVLPFCKQAADLGFPLRGLSLNFACMSDIPPTLSALQNAECALDIVRRFAPDADISAGGTDMLELAESERLPSSIREIRCGTGILLGLYPLSGKEIPGASQETFRLEGTVLECRVKAGRKLALFDFGCLHTEASRLSTPLHGMVLCGTSSAYTVFDITECPAPIAEGQSMDFRLDYHSLMLALGSRALPVEMAE